MSNLIIHRKSQFYWGGVFFSIYVNGVEVERIKRKETKTIPVTAGRIALEIRKGTFKNAIFFDITENETKSFEVSVKNTLLHTLIPIYSFIVKDSIFSIEPLKQ
ncbi:hypothetical protein [Gilliamella sp. wkB171]|uniref:hypothetical protein n=1 Tax=Gilliamella sp. wkB171 TaxID=3120258 RepID=UPI0008133C66|nr:hypothetical protein [Gilliamella apicola]OCL24921.1 hypothetical protein A9G03_03465 [Gilliamella apicola]